MSWANSVCSSISPHFHRALHQDNISVNLFVVNKPWLFSLLWCAGVDSVTTNACQLLQQMQNPLWLLVRTLELSLPLMSNLLFPLKPVPLHIYLPHMLLLGVLATEGTFPFP